MIYAVVQASIWSASKIKSAFFFLFLTCMLTCVPADPPYYAVKEVQNHCFPVRNICAHPMERSVLKSSEVETKEVEVLARSSLLFYSICSLLKLEQYCSIYSSFKNSVVTRGHFESFLLARWL